jgi:hypothetical protein
VLPAEWTVLYQLCQLSDDKLKRLVNERRLRPDLTAQKIEDYELAIDRSSPVVDGESAADTAVIRATKTPLQEEPPRPRGSENRSRPVAIIRAYDDFDEEGFREGIKKALKPVLKGKPLKLEFPERKSAIKENNRRTLASELTADLTRRLRSYEQARANLSKQDYQTLENAAWQHQQKFKTGRFPYERTEPTSVEHPDHPYCITKPQFSTRAMFLGWMRKQKLITAYNPIPDNPDLGEESCIKFAIEYCQAKTAKARRIAKAALDKLARPKSANKQHAEKYLKLIDRKGAL